MDWYGMLGKESGICLRLFTFQKGITELKDVGDPYNNVGATGLVARSNHCCPVIMGGGGQYNLWAIGW